MALPEPEERIPHRGRWSLLDRLEELGPTHAVAVARFDLDQVEGHFPGRPVVPGVLLVEALAQTLLCLDAEGTPGTPFLAGIDRVRFRAPVVPPAEVSLRVDVVTQRAGFTIGEGVATCAGEVVCTARFTGAILSEP